MHQRHVIVTGSNNSNDAAAPCCAHHPVSSKDSDAEEELKPTMAIATTKTFKRRKQQPRSASSFWPFNRVNRRRRAANKATAAIPGGKYPPALFQLLDMDMVATFLQVFSILIMVGCAVTLLARSMSSSSSISLDPNDHRLMKNQPPSSSRSSSWLNIFSWFTLGSSGGEWVSHFPPNHPYGVGLNAKYPKVPLEPSFIYKIPGSMAHIGDKSDHYAMLRKVFDAKDQLQELPQVQPQYQFQAVTTDGAQVVPYDVYNCPLEPPSGYPYAWNMLELLKAWPPDDSSIHQQVFQGLCVFDYERDLEKAYKYRDAELPFVVNGDPEVIKAVQRWNAPQYLERMLGRVRHRAEYSESNHFLYWNPPPGGANRGGANGNGNAAGKKRRRTMQREAPKDWKQPTEMIRMTYPEWLEHANVTDESLLGPDMPHWYFRLIGCGETGPEGQCDNGSSEYLFDELTFFQPKQSLYMVEPEEQKGIHCRFGMKGVIAENHFDGSRNYIVVLGGERRYILSHPDQCPYLSLLPKGHPSARHSAVDWSNPDLDAYPEFGMAKGNEVVLQAGDVLYLPTNWFHYIVSLSLNYQCNTRSGIGQDYMEPIHHCGF